MFRRFFSTYKKLPYNTPWAVSEDEVIKCEPITKKTLDGALKVIRESFIKEEPLCKAFGIFEEPGAADELLQLCCDAAKDGVSFVAIDTDTNEIVGAMFNKIQVRAPKGESYYENVRKNCKHKSLKGFYDFTIDLEVKVDIFERYNTTCALEMMHGAIMPIAKRRHVAGMLFSSSDKMGRLLYNGKDVKTPIGSEHKVITNANAVPTLVTALATSIYTQKISVKYGYDKLLEVNYHDCMFDGRKLNERIGLVQKTCWVIVNRLDN